MKEKWLFHGAVVPVDVETTAALVAEIKRLINVIGGMALAQPAQEPVAWADMNVTDRDVGLSWTPGQFHTQPLYTNSPAAQPAQRPWVGLTQEQFTEAARLAEAGNHLVAFQRIQQWLKEKNT